MIDYGQKESSVIRIPNVDIEPDLAGIPLKYVPTVVFLSVVPIYAGSISLCMFNFFLTGALFFYCGKKEKKGIPPFVNSNLIKLIEMVPMSSVIAPELITINSHNEYYRGEI